MNIEPGSKPASECELRADRCNHDCRWATLDRQALCAELTRQSEEADLAGMVLDGHPNLFSDSAVFLDEGRFLRQAETIAAIERVVAMPTFQARVLAHAPLSARFEPKAPAVFMGYDFHLSPGGARLIEINTNAGGGLLNAILARAQKVCCRDVEALLPGSLGGDDPEHLFMEMFRAEWRLERVANGVRTGAGPLEASRQYLGLAGDAQHAALMSELWRTAAIEPGIRSVVERFVSGRLGYLSRVAIDRGMTPAAALDFAESLARFIDADMLYRRMDDASEAAKSS